MKKFTHLKQKLVESENSEGGGFNAAYDGTTSRSAASDFGIFRVEDPSQRARLNAFLQTWAQKDYLDPRSAIALLRAKLNLAGLDFQFHPGIPLVPGAPIKFHLNRFGGTFGTTADHDLRHGFQETDGISEFNNGRGLYLILDLNQSGANGLYKFTISLKEESLESEEEEL